MKRPTSRASLHSLIRWIGHGLQRIPAEACTPFEPIVTAPAAEQSRARLELAQRLDRSRIPAHPAIS